MTIWFLVEIRYSYPSVPGEGPGQEAAGAARKLSLGTVFYASPEQLLGEVHLDHRTDIYSSDPEYWEIPFQRAAFRLRAGNHTEAIDPAEQATKFAPWKTQTWNCWPQYTAPSEERIKPTSLRRGPKKSSAF